MWHPNIHGFALICEHSVLLQLRRIINILNMLSLIEFQKKYRDFEKSSYFVLVYKAAKSKTRVTGCCGSSTNCSDNLKKTNKVFSNCVVFVFGVMIETE